MSSNGSTRENQSVSRVPASHADTNYWTSPRSMVRRRTFLRGSAVAVGGISLALIGCGSKEETGTTSSGAPAAANASGAAAAPAAPKAGGELSIVASSDPPSLDPYLQSAAGTYEFVGPIYSKLLAFAATEDIKPFENKLVGDLAASWETTPDGLTYVFKLRDGVKWQNVDPVNGRALTAEDVAFALNKMRTADPLYTSAYLLDPVSKIEAVDAKTVKFTMKNVFAPFLDSIAHQNALILPKEIFDKYKDGRKNAAGTGPFILDSQLAGSAHVLRRNPDYFGGQVYLDKVKYTVLPDAAAQVAAFRANQLDLISSNQKNQVEDVLKSNPKSQKFQLPGASGVRLVINNARKPYDDVRVRTAIDKAIDRRAIIETFLSGEGRMMAILGANCTPWDIPQAEIEAFFKPDPAEAKKLLDAAGFQNGFTTEWENSNAAPTNITVLELIQAALKPLKVDVKIKSVEYADWQKHANTQDFVAFMTGVRAATDPDGIFFRNYHPKSAQRWVELKGDEYKPLVELIDKQRTELDPKKRLEVAQNLTRGLLNSHLAPGLYDPKSYVLANPRVQGYAAHGLSGQAELKHVSIRA